MYNQICHRVIVVFDALRQLMYLIAISYTSTVCSNFDSRNTGNFHSNEFIEQIIPIDMLFNMLRGMLNLIKYH